jgi:hypothetical protein
MKKIRKSTWNSYWVTGYTYDVANDQQSAGGVHIHQIRKIKNKWQKRIVQSNGKFRAISQIEDLDEKEGLALFARCMTY